VACALHFPVAAAELAARVRANLERQVERELADIVVVRTRADLAAAGPFPPYVGELLDAFAAGRFTP
jgi:hypothetical protein